MPGRKYASAWSSALPPDRADMVTNSAPMPIPTRAFTTNCTDERCTSRTTSSTTAAATLTMSAVRRSFVVSHRTVKMIVGTAASIMPRRPPRALESWLRTTASTVSTDASELSAHEAVTDQLVARVVHEPVPVGDADPSLDLDPAAGRDPGDPPTAEPDDRDHAGAVVQLRLESGYAATRAAASRSAGCPAAGPARGRARRRSGPRRTRRTSCACRGRAGPCCSPTC